MSRTNLFFVRHGQTDYNAQKIIQGQSDRSNVPGIKDLGLNATGLHQARTLAQTLRAGCAPFDLVLSSDLKRAYETGEIIAETLGVPIETHKGLREMFFGCEWEGRTVDAFKATAFDPPLTFTDPTTGEPLLVPDGEVLRSYHKSTAPRYELIAHPGGETKLDVAARARAALHSFIEANPSKTSLLIPTHNGLLRFLMPVLGPVDHTECLHVVFDRDKDELTLISRTKNPKA